MKSFVNTNYQNFMIFFTFFLFWFGIQFGKVIEDSVAYMLVVTVGILHGANDLLILSSKEQHKKNRRKHLLIYVCLVFLCIFIFLINPLLAILAFIFLSAYHFGEEHFESKITFNKQFDSIYFMNYGLVIFSLIFYSSLEDVEAIMNELVGVSFTEKQLQISLLINSFSFLILNVFLYYKKKIRVNFLVTEFFYLILLSLVFSTTSLILGFAIYFIFWHSLPSIIHQIEFISGNLNKKSMLFYVKKALIYWAISIASLILLYMFLPRIELFATVIFVILFAVTAPHAWVMYKMKN